MRAIVNGKLYDTENSRLVSKIFEPYVENFKRSTRTYDVYRTRRGNVFAVVEDENILYDSEKVKQLLNGRPGDTDCYIEIFGKPKKA